MKIEQIKNGIQIVPYADHIYQWIITADKEESEEEVKNRCFDLMKADRTKDQYFTDYKDTNNFEEIMNIVCGGYYELSKIEDNPPTYKYTVTQEYID